MVVSDKGNKGQEDSTWVAVSQLLITSVTLGCPQSSEHNGFDEQLKRSWVKAGIESNFSLNFLP